MKKRSFKKTVVFASLIALWLVAGTSALVSSSVGLEPEPTHHHWLGRLVKAAPIQADQPLKVLFIGNSLTYYNNLPNILEQLAASSLKSRKLQARLIGFGGATLHDHWHKGVALAAIRQGTWDYVVLQEQSSLGAIYMINGTRWITPNPDFFHTYARLFDQEIKQAGAKTIFFLTWARRGTLPREQEALNYAYMQIAKELQAVVAPVGIAFQEAQSGEAELDLYLSDGSHPSSKGSYLAACVFFSLLYGKSPVGLSVRITGHPFDDRGILDTNRAVALVDLEQTNAGWLQRIAWNTQKKIAAAGGYLETLKPTTPKMPVLPAEHKPGNFKLEGMWKGWIKLYQQPAHMELRLSRSNGTWQAEGKIGFDGKREDIIPVVTALQVTDTGISFTDSKEFNGGITKYQAILKGTALSGIAEIITKDRHYYAIGTWELKPQR